MMHSQILLLFLCVLSRGSCDLVYYMDQMCGQTLDMSTPTNALWRVPIDLTSKNEFDSNMNCALEVVTKPTRKLSFHFTLFATEAGSLQLRDGNADSTYVSGISGPLSGPMHTIGKEFTTSDNRLYMLFTNSYFYTDKGFRMIVQSTSTGENASGHLDLHCGETFDFAALKIASYYLKGVSNEKGLYKIDRNCSVKFVTEPWDALTIQILCFKTVTSIASYYATLVCKSGGNPVNTDKVMGQNRLHNCPNMEASCSKKSSIQECPLCDCDWLDVKDGLTFPSPYVSGIDKKVCGFWNKTNTKYTTIGNQLLVRFKSDHGDQFRGFEMLISTKRNDAVIKGAFTVHCNSDNWDIVISMDKLRKLYPGLRTSDIYLGENKCTGSETLNDLKFQFGLDECLSNQKSLNGVSIYTNEIIAVERNPQFSFLIKDYRFRTAVECDVTGNGSASVGGFKDEVAIGQAANGQQQRMNISFYLSPNYAVKVAGNPLQATAGAQIYLKVFANINAWTTKMRLKTCYIIPSLDAESNMRYYLVKNGCEADANTHITSQLAHETRLVFDYFEYAGNRNGIYVICDGIICKAGDTSLQCKQACNPATSRKAQVTK